LAADTTEFGRAARTIVTGVDTLRTELATAPWLIRPWSAAPHYASGLCYVSANGIESELECAVPNADAIAAGSLLRARGLTRCTMPMRALPDHDGSARISDPRPSDPLRGRRPDVLKIAVARAQSREPSLCVGGRGASALLEYAHKSLANVRRH